MRTLRSTGKGPPSFLLQKGKLQILTAGGAAETEKFAPDKQVYVSCSVEIILVHNQSILKYISQVQVLCDLGQVN